MNGEKKSPVALITGLILLIYAMVLVSREAAAILGSTRQRLRLPMQTSKTIDTQVKRGTMEWNNLIVRDMESYPARAMKSKFDNVQVGAPMAGAA